ncbi:hypothetical protein GOEFS_051_00020 [Gordonia effusa NBRC 100432]|uniref:Uncharacterized protein n=1 Tax=Gordonia effusa NBRC 100432 TaxID=1077974 RepID=H0QZQ6_9ACTN|nr:hypothetical protein [Gordonia effusa]GAB18307.1 hypothetical protein GOEFS_051_00020 [Gordonia effusa NBRC 100432]
MHQSEPQEIRFSQLIEAHKTRTGVGDAELGRRIGTSRQNVLNWRTKPLMRLPASRHLMNLAWTIEMPYEVVLDAAVREIGYLPGESIILGEEVLDHLISGSAAQFARESAAILKASEDQATLIIGAAAVKFLILQWQTTTPDHAITFLRTYFAHLVKCEPSVTWGQVRQALRREIGVRLPTEERSALLERATNECTSARTSTIKGAIPL